MNSVFNIGLSGLRAFSAKMATSAHNTANALTDGYKTKRAVASEVKGGGVTTTIETIDQPNAEVYDSTGQTKKLSNTDLGREMVNTIVAQRGFEANIKSIQAADEMEQSLGSILDKKV